MFLEEYSYTSSDEFRNDVGMERSEEPPVTVIVRGMLAHSRQQDRVLVFVGQINITLDNKQPMASDTVVGTASETTRKGYKTAQFMQYSPYFAAVIRHP